MKRLLCVCLLLTLLAAAPAPLQAQTPPTLAFELSPGHHVPRELELTAAITLTNLDPGSYSSVIFHADITGHEERTGACFGDDAERDITIAVDQAVEVFTVSLFKPCSPQFGFVSYYYTIDFRVSKLDPGAPGQKTELATVSTGFLATRDLQPGEQIAPPPEPGALLWMDPDPSPLIVQSHTWYQFRFRAAIPSYETDHLGVIFSPNDHGLLRAVDSPQRPSLSRATEECRLAGDQLAHWRRAIHQSIWVVACREGPATIELRHELAPVGPLATYEFNVGGDHHTTTPPTTGGGGFGGGGGGGPSGPSPSKLDFEWTVTRDIESLDGGHGSPTGMWSDHTTLWIAENPDGPGDTVYAYDLASGERIEDRELQLDETNRAPRGLWSDRTTIWVSDSGQNRLFAHALASGNRLPDRDIALASRNHDARGIWSDEVTMWVLDGIKDALFAYDLATGDSLAEYALDSANGDPRGLWSDESAIWVSDDGAKRLFAYRLPPADAEEATEGEDEADEVESLQRVRNEEFDKLSRASNNSPRGIWSDGGLMYVADASDGKVYTYNMPDALDARLASLALSDLEMGEFKASHTDYTATLRAGVTLTTVEATTVQRRTEVAIHPPDADGDDANGHQVALEGVSEITVTVTSADGSRTRVYRVAIERPVVELTLDTGFNKIEWPGADGVAIADALSDVTDRVVVAYAWDEARGTWLIHLPDLPEVPGLNTLTTLARGAEYWVAAAEPLTWTVQPGR